VRRSRVLASTEHRFSARIGFWWTPLHHDQEDIMTHHASRKPLVLAIMSATAFAMTGFATIATAQESEPVAPATEATAPADTAAPATAAPVTINEQKIEQFADAYVAVQTIQTNAAKELDSSSSDPAKQQQTQQAVETEMIAAVEKSGLKLEEFNGIVQSMTADADLRARVVAEIKERSGG
jgi:Domain of unknown function (DUF4168)